MFSEVGYASRLNEERINKLMREDRKFESEFKEQSGQKELDHYVKAVQIDPKD